MATKPMAAPLAIYERPESFRILSAYWTLMKPEVNFLIGIAAAAAFYIGSPPSLLHFPWLLMANTVLGTLLTASGAGALNQWMEHPFDAKMRRTARRPIAAGSIEPRQALIFGAILSIAGVLYLELTVLPAAGLLALLTLVGYLFFYTPLKRRTPLCTLVGAFPGAMPILIGYVAAAGRLDGPAWLLYSILFLWQFPHFMAIAWMYREDYTRAAYRILPARGEGSFLVWLTGVPTLALFIVSMVASHQKEGAIGFVATAALGLGLAHYATRHIRVRSRMTARQLLKATILYLPLELLILALGKG